MSDELRVISTTMPRAQRKNGGSSVKTEIPGWPVRKILAPNVLILFQPVRLLFQRASSAKLFGKLRPEKIEQKRSRYAVGGIPGAG